MTHFKRYAAYYDLLYRDKDYRAEVDYIAGLLERHAPGCRRVLELGSGTGRHAALLAEGGYSMHCVDASEQMLAMARERLKDLPDEIADRLEVHAGDARTYRAGRQFDAVISLFHVASYQVENEDLLAMFATAAMHLQDGGVFVFDCWYGPAVISDRPVVKTLETENDALHVSRHTTPVMHAESNTVDVNFRVTITDKHDSTQEELAELHRMRYLFTPEVRHFLELNGFTLERAEHWMTGSEPGYDTWYVTYIARYDKSRNLPAR